MARPDIDRFSRKRLAELARRFMAQRDEIERTAALARAGMLCRFNDVEIRMLWVGGFLCPNDCFALKAAGRVDPRALDAPERRRKR